MIKENPFKIKFPFISTFENYSKRKKYYKKLMDLHRAYKDEVVYDGNDDDDDDDDDYFDDANCFYEYYDGRCRLYEEYTDRCRHHEGRCLLEIFCKVINLLYNRIEIKYYRRNQDEDYFMSYNTDKSYHETYFPYLIKYYKSDSDSDIDSGMERDIELDIEVISAYSDYSDYSD